MCGIFAINGTYGRELAEKLAALAATRGPHSHGWAYLGPDWELPVGYRALGPLDAKAIKEHLPDGSTAILGHARLATSGSASVTRQDDVQPIRGHGGRGFWLAHNGVVNHSVVADFAPAMRTTNDSEAIAILMGGCLDDCGVHRQRALACALAHAARGPGVAVALFDDGQIVASRVGRLPLHVRVAPDGSLAACSRPFDGSFELGDGQTIASPATAPVHDGPLLNGHGEIDGLRKLITTEGAA
jgi:glutamine phosphoribosylpyrophosphate amidotransferase